MYGIGKYIAEIEEMDGVELRVYNAGWKDATYFVKSDNLEVSVSTSEGKVNIDGELDTEADEKLCSQTIDYLEHSPEDDLLEPGSPTDILRGIAGLLGAH